MSFIAGILGNSDKEALQKIAGSKKAIQDLQEAKDVKYQTPEDLQRLLKEADRRVQSEMEIAKKNYADLSARAAAASKEK